MFQTYTDIHVLITLRCYCVGSTLLYVHGVEVFAKKKERTKYNKYGNKISDAQFSSFLKKRSEFRHFVYIYCITLTQFLLAYELKI